jgi:hypothetical protein
MSNRPEFRFVPGPARAFAAGEHRARRVEPLGNVAQPSPTQG